MSRSNRSRPISWKPCCETGPFAEYNLLKTDHYLIFYKSTLAFAQR